MDSNRKIVLVTQRTRLEDLIRRYNTYGQAEFYISHNGGDFVDYRLEHETYHIAVQTALSALQTFGRVQVLDRDFIPNYLFGKQDIVVALGRDGLVANVLKYLKDGQSLIGVNPDPKRWDGQLLPFLPEDLSNILPEVIRESRNAQSIQKLKTLKNFGLHPFTPLLLSVAAMTATAAASVDPIPEVSLPPPSLSTSRPASISSWTASL